MSEYVEWVYENQLARASRPAYPGDDVSLPEMQPWMSKVKDMGVRSIVCLLSDEQLRYYRQVPGGLLEHYRSEGFEVVSVPITDPFHDPAGYAELQAAIDTIIDHIRQLPKPVLVHCSAGVDRTGYVINEIQKRGILDPING